MPIEVEVPLLTISPDSKEGSNRRIVTENRMRVKSREWPFFVMIQSSTSSVYIHVFFKLPVIGMRSGRHHSLYLLYNRDLPAISGTLPLSPLISKRPCLLRFVTVWMQCAIDMMASRRFPVLSR
jgi:hypothetical protein